MKNKKFDFYKNDTSDKIICRVLIPKEAFDKVKSSVNINKSYIYIYSPNGQKISYSAHYNKPYVGVLIDKKDVYCGSWKIQAYIEWKGGVYFSNLHDVKIDDTTI